jgi:hypothetical protein
MKQVQYKQYVECCYLLRVPEIPYHSVMRDICIRGQWLLYLCTGCDKGQQLLLIFNQTEQLLTFNQSDISNRSRHKYYK